VADLAAAAKARPGALSYATFGNGAPPHLVGERMQALGQFRMTHVPYKGGQAALPDLLSGQLDVAIMDVVSMVPLIQAGRLRALAITGPRRAGSLPDVPTLAEAGIPFDTVGWYGIFGPAKMDPAAAARINAAVNRAMALPDMRAMLVDGGALPIDNPPTPPQWQAQFAEQVRVWGQIARDAHITLN
jgi:tripartite-type tricarboxylate transporter receptor subunit TctC